MPYTNPDPSLNISFSELQSFYQSTLPSKLQIQMADIRLPALLADGSPDKVQIPLNREEIRDYMQGSSEIDAGVPCGYEVVLTVAPGKHSDWLNAAKFKHNLKNTTTLAGLRKLLGDTFGVAYNDSDFLAYISKLPGVKVYIGL